MWRKSLKNSALWEEVKERPEEEVGRQPEVAASSNALYCARALAVDPEVLLMDEPGFCAGPGIDVENRGI